MKKANNPDILRAGFGPCTIITFYDPKTKSGYMIHEAHYQYIDLEAVIEEIKQDYGSLSRLKVFVTGGSLTSSDSVAQRKFEKSDRPHIEGIIRKYFKESQAEIKWLPDDHGATLFLYTQTGELELDADPFD